MICCDDNMPFVDDKRAGAERRRSAGEGSYDPAERRRYDRRELTVQDISFFEWATHFSVYQKRQGVPQDNPVVLRKKAA